MKTTILLGLLLGGLMCQESEDQDIKIEEGESKEPIRGPLSPGWIGPGKLISVAPTVAVRLGDGSQLTVKERGTWRVVTLEECEAHLAKTAKQYHEEMVAWGESGFGPGIVGNGSRLIVVLTVHPEAPWMDTRWLLDRSRLYSYNKVQVSTGSSPLNIGLPPESSVPFVPPTTAELLRVHVLGRGEVVSKWGGASVRRPEEVRYRVGGRAGREVAELRDVAGYLAARKAGAKQRAVSAIGVVTADGYVPSATVLDVLREFVKAGVEHVDPLGLLDEE